MAAGAGLHGNRASRLRGKKVEHPIAPSFLRKTTAPDAFAPCAWNTFFARSNPIVLTSNMDASVK